MVFPNKAFFTAVARHSGNNYTVDCIKTFSILYVTQSGGHVTVGCSGICSMLHVIALLPACYM